MAQAIANEVIPELLSSYRQSRGQGQAATPLAEDADVLAMARAVTGRGDAAALAELARLRARGLPLETIYLDVFAPAARLLGDWWCQDRSDFTEVTLGVWRLRLMMQRLAAEYHAVVGAETQSGSIALVPVAGDSHTFGAFIVGEVFRRRGWFVHTELATTNLALARLVRHEWFSVVGFSCSCSYQVESLSAAIRTVRRTSSNRGIVVMLGGALVNARPELVAEVGADFTAPDAVSAEWAARKAIAAAASCRA